MNICFIWMLFHTNLQILVSAYQISEGKKRFQLMNSWTRCYFWYRNCIFPNKETYIVSYISHCTCMKQLLLEEFLHLQLHRLCSLVLGRNSSGSGQENREYDRGDPLGWPHDTLYPQKLALTSPTNGGRSEATKFSLVQLRCFLSSLRKPKIHSISARKWILYSFLNKCLHYNSY
jgi:hypothetical protein